MRLEMVIGYLVALAVPLWLLGEQIISWCGSPKRIGHQLRSGRFLMKRAPKAPVAGTLVRPMRLAHPRKTV